MKLFSKYLAVALLPFISNLVQADSVKMSDGSLLSGKIVSADSAQLILETAYAGLVTVERLQIVDLKTELPVFTQLSNGTKLNSVLTPSAEQTVSVSVSGSSVAVPLTDISAIWTDASSDPDLIKEQAIAKAAERHWKYAAGVNIVGKSGNSSAFNIGLNLEARLESNNDLLRMYLRYNQGKQDGVESSDETVAGTSYTNYFTETLGWYVREELERDTFENIDFRSTTAAGLTYRVIKSERTSLEFRSGLNYRYEAYQDATISNSEPGLDFAILYEHTFSDWARLSTEISYEPSFDDFANYLLKHSSALLMPIAGTQNWSIQIGVRNDFNSIPALGKDKLDTTYYVNMVYSWE
jgi:putative salt-induced outer membrane protein YdiY